MLALKCKDREIDLAMSVDVSDRAKLAVRETVTHMPTQDHQAPATKRTPEKLHLVHVFPSFGLGGVPIRIATIINHLGPRYRHTIIATDGCFDSQTRLDPSLDVSFKTVKSSRYGLLSTFRQARRTLRSLRPDLLLTYNWGAVEWGLANAIFPLCRHIHFESGFGIEESEGQLRRRVLFRRLALARADHLVVPSQTLVEIASKIWRIANKKLLYIPNGVDCRRFAAPPKPDALPGFERRPGELVIGTVAPLRAEKNLGRLIRAFAELEDKSFARLVIVGDGSERRRLEDLARELGIAEQTHFAGSVEDVGSVLGHFDIFALSSDTEQMPNSILQAMAAGLPVVATDVGDVAHILAPANRRFVVTRDNVTQFSDALIELLADKCLRDKVGSRNKAHVRAHYDLNQMVQAYRQIFDA
jgi:glycosyltransferase involved in cell wall biosynthesis